jgi:hypothetical protein
LLHSCSSVPDTYIGWHINCGLIANPRISSFFLFVFLVFGYFGSHRPLQHPPGVLSLPVAYPSSQIRTFSVHTGTRYNGTHAGDVLAVLGWTQHDALEKQAMVGLKGGG